MTIRAFGRFLPQSYGTQLQLQWRPKYNCLTPGRMRLPRS